MRQPLNLTGPPNQRPTKMPPGENGNMNWIETTKALPPESNDFSRLIFPNGSPSDPVLTWVNGLTFPVVGRYYHSSKEWVLVGLKKDDAHVVTHWTEFNPPQP